MLLGATPNGLLHLTAAGGQRLADAAVICYCLFGPQLRDNALPVAAVKHIPHEFRPCNLIRDSAE